MANASPHTHDLQVREGNSAWVITYGDQQKLATKWLPFLKWRLDYEIKKIMRDHDKGSLKYAKQEEKAEKIKAVARAHAERVQHGYRTFDVWASDTKALAEAKMLAEAYDMNKQYDYEHRYSRAALGTAALGTGITRNSFISSSKQY